MKRKPIKVDWDALDEAFNDQNEELAHYLDLVTGHVALDGEDDVEDDEEDYEHAAVEPTSPPRDDATRLYVHPPDTETKIGWLEEFLAAQRDLEPGVVLLLEEALRSDDPAEQVAAALSERPEERERWYRYRSDRIHDLIDRWLAEHEVALVEGPPWRAAGEG